MDLVSLNSCSNKEYFLIGQIFDRTLPIFRILNVRLQHKNSRSCLMTDRYLHHCSVSYFFFLYRSPSLSLCTVFNSISSNIDGVLSINPSANVFVLRDFNVHHKHWLIYSGGTDRPVEHCYNFSISNDLTQIVNFPTWIPVVIVTVLLFWIDLFLLTLIFVLQWLSLHWEILIMLLSKFPLSFR